MEIRDLAHGMANAGFALHDFPTTDSGVQGQTTYYGVLL